MLETPSCKVFLLLSPCGPLFTWCKMEWIQLEGCRRPSPFEQLEQYCGICALKSYWIDKPFAKDVQFWLPIKRQGSFFVCSCLVWKTYFVTCLQKCLLEYIRQVRQVGCKTKLVFFVRSEAVTKSSLSRLDFYGRQEAAEPAMQGWASASHLHGHASMNSFSKEMDLQCPLFLKIQ